MSDKSIENLGLQSGGEADVEPAAEKHTKKGAKRSKEFRDNIITDSETAKARGKKGGERSGEVRRENAQRRKDAREAVRYLLDMAAKGKLKNNLKELGYPEDECTNMAALQARIFTAVMQTGNLEAYATLMKVAGYDPDEIRKERESLASDRRRDLEVDAKISALGQRGADASVSVALNDEDDNDDVVIYMPQIASEESCQEQPEQETTTIPNSDDPLGSEE